MKRQAKVEEAKKKEEERLEIEREQQRITEAREYYKRGIIIKYVLIPLAKNVEMVKDKEFFADVQYVTWVKRNGLLFLNRAVYLSKIEKQAELQRKLNYASSAYHYSLKSLALKHLNLHVIDQRK
jgi:hypothetical protein